MFKLCWQLARKDLWHDRNVSLCMMTALMAVMAPLLLLFGLKYGVVSQLQYQLAQKPNLLEIKAQSRANNLNQAWIEQTQQRADVKFAIGLTRSLNAEAAIFKTERAAKTTASNLLYAEIIPTASGDPLLKNSPVPALVDKQGVISYALAQQLNTKAGDTVYLRLTRTKEGQKKPIYLAIDVVHILAPQDFNRRAVFLSMPVVLGIEYFIDDINQDFTLVQHTPEDYVFANVRIYANTIDDVLSLSEWLEQQHLSTNSAQEAIHNTKTINHILTFIFSVIALTALIGGVVSLSGSFLTNIDRKRQQIATLRLVGFNKNHITVYITFQVFLITFFSYLAALLFYFVGSFIFNNALGSSAQTVRFSSYLPIHYLVITFLITAVLALLIALIGAVQTTRIEPAESLREI